MMSSAEHLEQAYIAPIRSVVAIDDHFPTLDNLLETGEAMDSSLPGVAQLTNFLTYCRQQEWLVDVHDGSKIGIDPGAGLAKNLHQTDLLVLDYNLNGQDDDGTKCIAILRELARNPHFNLVVIYTNANHERAFGEIATSLLSPSMIEMDETLEASIGDFWDDLKSDNTLNLQQFDEAVGRSGFLKAREDTDQPSVEVLKVAFPPLARLGKEIGQKLSDHLRSDDAAVRFTVDDICRWLFKRHERSSENLDPSGVRSVSVGTVAGTKTNWIRTDNLFVTIVSKADAEGKDIVGCLVEALKGWNPTPHRLILSRLRAVLENDGGSIEASALKNKFVQAGLLYQVLDCADEERQTHVDALVQRQWNEVLQSLSEKVSPFAMSVIEQEAGEAGSDKIGRIGHHYAKGLGDIDENKMVDISLHLNWYVSTEPISGFHLKTGHIFRFQDDLWVCLSPMCDLVPGQGNDRRWRRKLGQENLPFKAVKLHEIEDKELVLKRAQSGDCIFLKQGPEVVTYGYVPLGDDVVEPNPHWELMLAADQGRVAAGAVSLLGIERGDDHPVRLTELEPAELVGQLRYEYALNLLQRLAGNQARVGLDYVANLYG